MQPIRLLRYVYLIGFFGVLPILGAMLLVRLIAPSDTYTGTGAIAWVLTLFRDQRAPATIVLFTILEVTLWNQRHRLPWADLLASLDRADIPMKYRASYDRAGALLDDVERIQRQNKRGIERDLSSAERDALAQSLEELRTSMAAEPFRGSVLEDALAQAEDEVDRKLGSWRKGELREYTESIGVAIGVAILLRIFVVEAFKIPSGSMIPTLQVGDHIFVNKMSFGPLIPWTTKRILPQLPPKRGDVIVFEFPENKEQDFIKRVVAVPGDRLEVKGGHPIINGWKVPWCNVGTFTYRETSTSPPHRAELDVEFLEDKSYLTLYERSYAGGADMQGPYFVKADEVWVMGDNRDNSHDSRGWYEGRGGGVPSQNLKGRAMFVWLSVDTAGSAAWDRLGVSVMGKPVLPKNTDPAIVSGLEKCMASRPPLSETTPPPRAPLPSRVTQRLRRRDGGPRAVSLRQELRGRSQRLRARRQGRVASVRSAGPDVFQEQETETMTKTSSVFALVGVGLSVLASASVVGCGKKEEAPAAPAPAQTTIVTANGVQVQVREESGVTRYSDEGPEIGTVRTNRTVELRKSADNTSPVVGNIGPGIMVNKKARRGAFYLVDFPANGGGMTPGWLDQHEVTGGALPVVTTTTVPPVATTTTPPPVATTAPPVATTTAPPGGRPPIRIPGKK